MNEKHDVSRDNGTVKGQYANYFKIGFNAVEFVFDFGQCYQENGEALFHTRIITSPVYARALLETLQKCIEQYEKTFEVIPKENAT